MLKFIMRIKREHLFEVIILVIFIAGALVTSRSASSAPRDPFFRVYFLDVGQGDAILLRSPEGVTILIDGGPSRKVLEELAEVLPFDETYIDVVVSTHTDADHITGLVDVLKRYDVGHIIETGMQCVTAICNAWQETAQAEGAERSYAYQGYGIQISENSKAIFLNPPTSVKDTKLSKTNNGSLVMRFDYASQSFLFTGDIEKTVEQRLVRESALIDVDVLKIAHHGSKTSSVAEFLKTASPKIAVIQVGSKNTYGHPAPQTIAELDKIPEIQYYRNDLQGRIEIILDGHAYNVKTEH